MNGISEYLRILPNETRHELQKRQRNFKEFQSVYRHISEVKTTCEDLKNKKTSMRKLEASSTQRIEQNDQKMADSKIKRNLEDENTMSTLNLKGSISDELCKQNKEESPLHDTPYNSYCSELSFQELFDKVNYTEQQIMKVSKTVDSINSMIMKKSLRCFQRNEN